MLETNIRELNEKIQKESQFIDMINMEMNKVIIGQKHMTERLLIGLLADGHILLEGVPGLAKTLAINSLANVISAKFSRIQFTPDLLPGDITGNPVLQETDKGREFVFQEGPLFANIVLADEINRASPKTQSALLQAMQEHHVTIAGERHDLPAPFHVLATQNPLEQEGTYPLPEAQLDRFLVQIDVEYPDRETEKAIILATTGMQDGAVSQVFSAQELLDAQTLLRRMPVGDAVLELILDLVRACRPDDELASDAVRQNVSWGPGPRAAQALMLMVRAAALLDGRLAPTLDDVIDMARPVLMHRMALSFAAKARGQTLGDLIDSVVAQVIRSEAAA